METSGWKLRPPLPPASCPTCARAPCHLPAGGGTGSWVPGTEGRGGEPTPTLWSAPPRPEAVARETLLTPRPRPGSLRTQELGGTRTRSGLCPESSPAGSHWTWQRGVSQRRRGGDRAGGDRAEGRGAGRYGRPREGAGYGQGWAAGRQDSPAEARSSKGVTILRQPPPGAGGTLETTMASGGAGTAGRAGLPERECAEFPGSPRFYPGGGMLLDQSPK